MDFKELFRHKVHFEVLEFFEIFLRAWSSQYVNFSFITLNLQLATWNTYLLSFSLKWAFSHRIGLKSLTPDTARRSWCVHVIPQTCFVCFFLSFGLSLYSFQSLQEGMLRKALFHLQEDIIAVLSYKLAEVERVLKYLTIVWITVSLGCFDLTPLDDWQKIDLVWTSYAPYTQSEFPSR